MRHLASAETDVLVDRVLDHLGLRGETNAPADLLEAQFAEIEAIESDRTPIRAPQTDEESGQGALAAALGAEDSHPFAGFGAEVESPEDRWRVLVREVQIARLEFHRRMIPPTGDVGSLLWFERQVDQVSELVRRG